MIGNRIIVAKVVLGEENMNIVVHMHHKLEQEGG